jgi:HEPN domain-containing protein
VSAERGVSVADEWMRIARKDWRRAERNLKGRDPEAAGFFLQQSLEKYLKAFLLKHNWKLRKIHELDALLDEASKLQPELETYRPVRARFRLLHGGALSALERLRAFRGRHSKRPKGGA